MTSQISVHRYQTQKTHLISGGMRLALMIAILSFLVLLKLNSRTIACLELKTYKYKWKTEKKKLKSHEAVLLSY